MREHGTRTKYIWDGCRCLPCRIANARYETRRAARHRPPYRVHHVGGNWYIVRHTQSGATLFKTKDALGAQRKKDELNRAHPHDPDWYPLWAGATIHAVRLHVKRLQARGLGYKRIAQLAGIAPSHLLEIIHGERFRKDRPRHFRVKTTTAEKLLGVQVVSEPALGARVPAAEAWELVAQLRAQGWTKGRIAQALGNKLPALQLGKDYVLQRHVLRLRELTGGIRRQLSA